MKNQKEKYEQIKQWVKDAITDGWSIEPTYKMESIEQAATLKKEGFEVLVIMRHNICSIDAWGPDRLHVNTGKIYSWEKLNKELRHCYSCGSEDVDTTRFSFAGRCCKTCLPKMRELYEKPGWYN